MARWVIRAGAPSDADRLADLEALAFAAKSWGRDSVKESFVAPRVTVLFGGESGKEPGGFAVWRDLGPEAELLTLGVAPALQGQGLGGALLAAVLEAARDQGAGRLFLEVAAGNMPARRLYESVGFEMIGMRRAYYRNGDDAIVMARATDSASP